jgi:hypothetical protein
LGIRNGNGKSVERRGRGGKAQRRAGRFASRIPTHRIRRDEWGTRHPDLCRSWLLVDVFGEGFDGFEGLGFGFGVAGDDDAVGFEVGDAVIGAVAEEDRFAEH